MVLPHIPEVAISVPIAMYMPYLIAFRSLANMFHHLMILIKQKW